MIEMNLGLGLYEINNPEFQEKDFKEGSIAEKVMIVDDQKDKSGDESSSSSGSDSLLDDEDYRNMQMKAMWGAFQSQNTYKDNESQGQKPQVNIQVLNEQNN